ncbi:exonuclease domain-containing protein, partial [Tepidiforma sp.]|uniref:exonuclease domain-containing protein n=1 Tax=Tepidiforma sp. TaxID=2682230 RepID=UPI002ADE66B3
MTTFIALDLETTGLDPETDRIVEVGAVRFDESGERIDEFSALVNPGRRLPVFIERLTGISNRDLAGADRFDRLRLRLEAYLGDGVVVGHNVAFDLEFLAKAGVRWSGRSIDTAMAARVVKPGLANYGLEEVAASLGIVSETHHRALPDARLAGRVFFELLETVKGLPERERRAVADVLAQEDPAWREVLGYDERPPAEAAALPVPRPFAAPPPLKPADRPEPVTPNDVRRVFAALADVVTGFEARPEQQEMTEAVRRAFVRGGHLMVEAGTGVGKSLAYLIPAALDAVRNGRTVVVSTHTIALQEQLVQKDIPILRAALARAGVIDDPASLRVVLLKGRANYLCYARWLAGFMAGARDPEVAALAASTVRWVSLTETGDRAELRLAPDQLGAWRRLSAADATCLADQNRHVRAGNCFLWRARESAKAAHIIVVNHALLLADAVNAGSALPPFQHLIVDEAHNLEDVATTQFGASLTPRVVSDVLDRLHRPGARDARESGIAVLLKALGTDEAAKAATKLQEAVAASRRAAVPFFLAAGALPGEPRDDNRIAITAAVRHREAWERLEVAWEALSEQFAAVG